MITLDAIVRGYKVRHGQTTLHNYLRYLKFLVDFLRDVALTHAIFDKTVALKMDQKKAIQVPEDYVIWSKIGYQQGDRIAAFERDNTINLNHEISDDGLEAPTANEKFNIGKFPYTRLTFNNFTNQDGELGCLEGIGLGHNGVGYFRPTSDREIQFSSDISIDTVIYLEYKTNGFNPTTKSTVPDIMSKLGEDYIHWQEARRKFGDAATETRAREIAYGKEYDNVLAKMNPFSIAALQGSRARSFDGNKLVY